MPRLVLVSVSLIIGITLGYSAFQFKTPRTTSNLDDAPQLMTPAAQSKELLIQSGVLEEKAVSSGFQDGLRLVQPDNKTLQQRLLHLESEFVTIQSSLKSVLNLLGTIQVNERTEQGELAVFDEGYDDGYSEEIYVEQDDEIRAGTSELTQDSFRVAQNLEHDESGYDIEWAVAQEAEIQQVLLDQDQFQGITLAALDCRTTSCRATFYLADDLPPHMEALLVGSLGKNLPHALWEKNGNQLTLLLSEASDTM